MNAIKILAINLGILLGLLLLAEGGASLVLPATEKAPIHDERAKSFPMQMGAMTFAKARTYRVHRPFASEGYNVSEDGFRGGQQTEAAGASVASARKLRIFAFGGSSTFGIGVRDHETWPYILGTMATEYEVVNFGLGGFDNFDEMHLFVDVVAAGGIPAVAIFLDGVNELCPQAPDRSEAYRPFIDATREWVTFAFKQSALYRLSQRLRARFFPPPSSMNVMRDFSTCAARYISNVKVINTLAKSSGIKTYFFLQPNGALIPNAKTYRFWSYGNPDDNLSGFYKEYYNAIMRAAESSGVSNIFDISNVLSDMALHNADLFFDWQHPNKDANHKVANSILEHIRK